MRQVRVFLIILAVLTVPVTCLADVFFRIEWYEDWLQCSGEGDAVILIHGFIGSRAEWTSPPPYLPPTDQAAFVSVFDALAADYRVIAADSRGHGKVTSPMMPGNTASRW